MKKLLILSLLFFVAVGTTFGQRTDLKGPKAKNQKVWENKSKAQNTLVSASSEAKLKGPEAKNQKPFTKAANLKTKKVENGNPKAKPKGPKAKNSKPHWKKKTKKVEVQKTKTEDLIVKN